MFINAITNYWYINILTLPPLSILTNHCSALRLLTVITKKGDNEKAKEDLFKAIDQEFNFDIDVWFVVPLFVVVGCLGFIVS